MSKEVKIVPYKNDKGEERINLFVIESASKRTDLGDVTQVSGKLNSLRWANFAFNGSIFAIGSIPLSVDAGTKIVHGIVEQNPGEVVSGFAEFMAGLYMSKMGWDRGWARNGEIVDAQSRWNTALKQVPAILLPHGMEKS